MNIRDLSYVVAVAELGNFSKAAEKCFVSQPALSSQIKKLEDYLGISLFERDKRRVAVTPAGREVVRRARIIIEEYEDLISVARSAGTDAFERLGLACFPTLAPYLLPLIVPALKSAMPRLDLEIYEYKSADIIERLKQGTLDMGLLALPVGDAALEMRTLFREEFVLCVPVDHPLAGNESVSYDDLRGEVMLLLEEGHCMRDQSFEICALSGLEYRDDFSATSLATLKQMVVAGAGLTLVPALSMPHSDAHLRYLRIGPNPPSRTIAAVWRTGSPRVALLDKVLDLLPESIADYAESRSLITQIEEPH